MKAKFDDFLREIGIAVATEATDAMEDVTGDYSDGRDDAMSDQSAALLLGQDETVDVEAGQD